LSFLFAVHSGGGRPAVPPSNTNSAPDKEKDEMKKLLMLSLTMALMLAAPAAQLAHAEEGDPHVLALMHQINGQLKAQGQNLAVEQIEFFTIGAGRPVNRLHQTGSRWVPNDPRRLADGDNITYLVDQSEGATASGLTNAATEAAIDRALATWDSVESCLANVDFVKRPDSGADPDIFDAFFGFGGFGNPFLADIVNAGWYPKSFFEAVIPGGGNGVLAFSVTFVFTGPGGVASDINGDNHLDSALNEVYYNNAFFWGINTPIPKVDVETVALHENGHSLDLGHFGPPPAAVMNPVYAGIRHQPLPIDHAGMCTVWSSWPNP
jgi:hypothetical protein